MKKVKGLFVLFTFTLIIILTGCASEESADTLSDVETEQNVVADEEKNEAITESAPVNLEEEAAVNVNDENEAKSMQVNSQQATNSNNESILVQNIGEPNQTIEPEPFDIDAYYENAHRELVEIGNSYKILNLEMLDYIIRNAEYLVMLFYTDGCFAKVYNSANMLEEQPAIVSQIPDAVFANIDLEDYPELGEIIGIEEAPYSIFLQRGRPVHIQEEYMSPAEIIDVINTKIK